MKGHLMVTGLIIIMAACNTQNSSEMQLDSKKELLGSYHRNVKLGIGYNVPAGFVKVTDEKLIIRCKASLPLSDEELLANAIYQDYESGSFMVVSEMRSNMWEKFEEYAVLMNTSPLSLKWNHISSTTFRYNDYNIQQWLLRNHEWVNYKLLFQKDQVVFQVDYFIPMKIFGNGFAQLIDSSIGTFKSIKTN